MGGILSSLLGRLQVLQVKLLLVGVMPKQGFYGCEQVTQNSINMLSEPCLFFMLGERS